MGNRIFISYSRKDTDYVSSLVTALREQGFEVWFDKNIRTGTDWDDTIEEEIKKSDAIVLILSETSVASENVKDEISYAIGLDKSVNPIKIEECDVPMRLARRQYVDFTILGHEAGFERLVNDLKQNLQISNENKKLSNGSFKPPTPQNKVALTVDTPRKVSRKITPYIIGGVIAIVLVFVLIMSVDDEVVADPKQNIVEPDAAAWDSANEINSVNGYVEYINTYGVKDKYYRAAQDSIDALMLYEGGAVYSVGNDKYFVKNIYTDMNGKMTVGDDDNQFPKKGDIITALRSQELSDSETYQIISPDIKLDAGDKVRVIGVKEVSNIVYISIFYPEWSLGR